LNTEIAGRAEVQRRLGQLPPRREEYPGRISIALAGVHVDDGPKNSAGEMSCGSPWWRTKRPTAHRVALRLGIAVMRGIGLGLTLVQHIVGVHGEHVEIASRLNEGTSVRVFLPRASM